MYIGKVVGTVVSTRKDESLEGAKLLIVQPLDLGLEARGSPLVMADTVGAGIGELVLYAMGAAARHAYGKNAAALDAAAVGIIDEIDNSGWNGKSGGSGGGLFVE
jgi:ethanolamine utilization protein EutN